MTCAEGRSVSSQIHAEWCWSEAVWKTRAARKSLRRDHISAAPISPVACVEASMRHALSHPSHCPPRPPASQCSPHPPPSYSYSSLRPLSNSPVLISQPPSLSKKDSPREKEVVLKRIVEGHSRRCWEAWLRKREAELDAVAHYQHRPTTTTTTAATTNNRRHSETAQQASHKSCVGIGSEEAWS